MDYDQRARSGQAKALPMNKKLLGIAAVVLLVVAGAGYQFVPPKPAVAKAKPHIAGTIYLLGKQFTVNLANQRYAMLTVGLELAPGAPPTSLASTATPPSGFGSMAEEGAVRAVITNDLVGVKARDLLDQS